MSSTPEAAAPITTSADDATTPATPADAPSPFRAWTRGRPFVGGLLVVLAGIELFLSGQLDFGHIHLQFGIQGMQAMVIPIVLVVLGVLIWTMPVHRVFYGVIALVLSLYALIGVNLGGFFIGMLLGVVGAIVSVSWLPRQAADEAVTADAESASEDHASDTDEPADDYSLVPGFADAPTEPATIAPVETEPLAPVASVAEPSSPPTLTLHTAETAGADTASGPRPFLDASADAGAAPDSSPAPTTSHRGRRLTRTTGAAVVVLCVAAGVGAVNATQAPTANAATPHDLTLPTLLHQLLVPGASDDAASTATATPSAPASSAAKPTPAPTSTSTSTSGPSTPAASSTPSATPDASATKPTTAPAKSPAAPASASASPTPTSPLPAATTPAPQLASTPGLPVAPALVSHLVGSTLDLTNAHYVGNVTLQRADGSTVEVMKFTTSKTVIDDFSLDVPNGDGHGLITTASKVTNSGHVVLYATRLEGHLLGFKFTFLPSTPPPTIIPLPSLSDPRIDLVATTSDTSSWSNTHEKLY